MSPPPLSFPTTQPAFIEWQSIIYRSLPPCKKFWSKKPNVTTKVTLYEPPMILTPTTDNSWVHWLISSNETKIYGNTLKCFYHGDYKYTEVLSVCHRSVSSTIGKITHTMSVQQVFPPNTTKLCKVCWKYQWFTTNPLTLYASLSSVYTQGRRAHLCKSHHQGTTLCRWWRCLLPKECV